MAGSIGILSSSESPSLAGCYDGNGAWVVETSAWVPPSVSGDTCIFMESPGFDRGTIIRLQTLQLLSFSAENRDELSCQPHYTRRCGGDAPN